MPWRPNALLQAGRRAAHLRQFPQPLTPISSLRQPQTRTYAAGAEPEQEHIAAAPEINFSQFRERTARVIPASPSYFTGQPNFIDGLLDLERLLVKYESLPTVPVDQAPLMTWLKIEQFHESLGEPVPVKRYRDMIRMLQRLNQIDPALAPQEVREKLHGFLRPGNPRTSKPLPPTVDELGRSRGKGKRKTSSAVVWLVEGEGEFMVNGKSLFDLFTRLHDRESATWPLRCVQRLDKYNVWATVKGGGVTGQAEAVTLALARALVVQEPALKPLLRKGESIPGSVEVVANLFSRCYYGGCPTGGAKEAGSSQGAHCSAMGQEVNHCHVQYAFSRSAFILSEECIMFNLPLVDMVSASRRIRRNKNNKKSNNIHAAAFNNCKTP